jgi:hypothetical protein
MALMDGETFTLERAMTALRAHAPELKAKGVLHAAVFGSTARGEAGPGSDVDVLVEIDPGREMDLIDYGSLSEDVRAMFGGRGDMANLRTLKPHVRPSALRDAVYAF